MTSLHNKLAGIQLGGFEKRTHSGKLGKKIKVTTNFFEITDLPQICIHQYVPFFSHPIPSPSGISLTLCRYDVNITPDVPPILNRYVYPDPISLYLIPFSLHLSDCGSNGSGSVG